MTDDQRRQQDPVLWTIGHSTRSSEDFLALLRAHGVRQLLDVRVIPFSRRNPQFNSTTLERQLQQAGVIYRTLGALGGRRKARSDSVNLGWRNASFRGYADYMQTETFWAGIQDLAGLAGEQPTAIMCAEAVPWRCHRSLIADAMLSRGWSVRHILSLTKADAHTLTPFAHVADAKVVYPKTPASDSTPGLF